MTTPKLIRSYLKLEIDYLSDKICLTSTKQKKIIKRHTLHILVSTSVLHRMTCWPRPFFSIYGMAKFRYQNTEACYICLKYFLKIAEKSNNYRFYLPSFLKFCDNISHKLLGPSQLVEKFIEILEWSTLQK